MGFEWLPAKNYKKHYICLHCQKGFKRASDEDRKHKRAKENIHSLMETYYASNQRLNIVQYIDAVHIQQQEFCPQCQEAMIQVSYVFEVPRQRNQRAWNALKERLGTKQMLDYQRYIHWHEMQLKNADLDKVLLAQIQNNLGLLKHV
ncbi:MAG: hypothetical protein AB8E82_08385 [Aureispira sp.]